jgi:hypothetical protein
MVVTEVKRERWQLFKGLSKEVHIKEITMCAVYVNWIWRWKQAKEIVARRDQTAAVGPSGPFETVVLWPLA